MQKTGSIKIVLEEGKMPLIEAELVNGNIWMSKYAMARLLNCYPQKIEANLRTLFKEHLLWESDCTYNHRYMDNGIEKQCLYYNLEVLIFMSYRINTLEASIFRQFLTSALCEHLQRNKSRETILFWTYHPKQNCSRLN